MKFIREHRRALIILTLIPSITLTFLIVIYIINPYALYWTGFFAYPISTTTSTTTTTKNSNDTTISTTEGTVTQYYPGKTLWDFLELAAIPIVLAGGAFWFNRAQNISNQTIAANQQEDVLLQRYMDAMTDLVLERGLRSTKENVPTDIDLRNIARSRTLTVLRALVTSEEGHNRRKGSVVRFLYETQLINKDKPVISLNKANIEEAYMRNYDLRNVYFCGADLYRAILCGANLQGADLMTAYLVEANLQGADLTDAKLNGADLRGADLTNAKLNGVDLRGATYGLHQGRRTIWPQHFTLTGNGMKEG